MEYDTTVDIPDEEIKDYCKDNFAVDDVFDMDDIVECVADSGRLPEDVFKFAQLKEWADRNGFIEA